MEAKTSKCPKTTSGNHSWQYIDIKEMDRLEALSATLHPKKFSTRKKCEACGLIDDKYVDVTLPSIDDVM